MTEVIAAVSAAVTTVTFAATNLYVMRACQQASRTGRSVRGKFGLSPSLEIDAEPKQPK